MISMSESKVFVERIGIKFSLVLINTIFTLPTVLCVAVVEGRNSSGKGIASAVVVVVVVVVVVAGSNQKRRRRRRKTTTTSNHSFDDECCCCFAVVVRKGGTCNNSCHASLFFFHRRRCFSFFYPLSLPLSHNIPRSPSFRFPLSTRFCPRHSIRLPLLLVVVVVIVLIVTGKQIGRAHV